jgi:hypothetical protein
MSGTASETVVNFIITPVGPSSQYPARPQLNHQPSENWLFVILALLVMPSFGVATAAAWIGGLGVLTGARFERCSQCGHYGLLTNQGLGPVQGCPHGVHFHKAA